MRSLEEIEDALCEVIKQLRQCHHDSAELRILPVILEFVRGEQEIDELLYVIHTLP